MFQKNEHDSQTMDTIIGSSIQVEGNFVGDGNIIIEGEVRGNLKTSQNIEAGEGSKIIADIESSNALIAGEVHGNLKITERLELANTARIIGNIEASILVAESGSTIDGNCKIGGNQANTEKEYKEEEPSEDEQ